MAEFTRSEGEHLLDIAEEVLRSRLVGRTPPPVPIDEFPDALRTGNPAFVTLLVRGRLNGCIGDLSGATPLAESVARLAQRSAFDDPRLPALRPADLEHLTIEISLLSPPVPVPADTRARLFDRLEPQRHGLILSCGRHGALFLPTVWCQLPDRDDFVDRLLVKAGLPPEPWPLDLHAELFTTVSFERTVGSMTR